MGRDTVVGYGSVLVPTQGGRHERVAHMYAPQPSSMLQRFRAWVSGAYPEVKIKSHICVYAVGVTVRALTLALRVEAY